MFQDATTQEATTQNATLAASGRTGDICQSTGPYRCSTSPEVIVSVKKGASFPLAPQTGSTTGQSTTWTFVGPTTSTVPTI
jgi:hypothetical protein